MRSTTRSRPSMPGEQSVVFPGAPAGILYPTDPGVSRTLAPPGNHDFAPRIGLAYSPNAAGDGLLGKILGGPGKTSIRASYGMFYTAIEALTIGVMSANAPYGTTYTSPAPPLFRHAVCHRVDRPESWPIFPGDARSVELHRQIIPTRTSIGRSSSPSPACRTIPTTNRIPYTEEYMFSLRARIRCEHRAQRELCRHAGPSPSGSRRSESGQPGTVSVLEQSRESCRRDRLPAALSAKTRRIRPRRARFINGTRGPLGSNFGSNANQATIGNSNYNALQITLRHTSKRLTVLAGYTFSKSQDQSSNLGEEVNPFDPSLSKALSAFDVKHNFVVSYNYQLPFEQSLPRIKSLDARLGTFRNHPFQQRPSGDAGQLRR